MKVSRLRRSRFDRRAIRAAEIGTAATCALSAYRRIFGPSCWGDFDRDAFDALDRALQGKAPVPR